MHYERADLVVVGGGVMGACVAWQAARRRVSVLLVEQYRPGHRLGSSHGESRIIRYSYPEPFYVELMKAAFGEWHQLEEAAEERLYLRCGGLDLARRGLGYVEARAAALQAAGLPFQELDEGALRLRYPQFRLEDDTLGLFQPDTGILAADTSLLAAWRAAGRQGARLVTDTPIERLDLEHERPTAVAEGVAFRGRWLVVAAGPWLPRLLPDLAPVLRVTRQQYAFFAPQEPGLFAPGKLPVFIVQEGERTYYGLPLFGRQGVKCARHGSDEEVTPENCRRSVDPAALEELRDFLRRWLPGAEGPVVHSGVCLYTETPDRHFLLDRHPEREDVVVAGGFSGHGFKFAPLVGRIALELLSGGTDLPVTAFSLNRQALAAGGRSEPPGKGPVPR